MYKGALQGCRTALGPTHPTTLTTAESLAALLSEEEGRLGEATQLYREVVEGRRQVLRENHPDTLRSISKVCESLCVLQQP